MGIEYDMTYEVKVAAPSTKPIFTYVDFIREIANWIDENGIVLDEQKPFYETGFMTLTFFIANKDDAFKFKMRWG